MKVLNRLNIVTSDTGRLDVDASFKEAVSGGINIKLDYNNKKDSLIVKSTDYYSTPKIEFSKEATGNQKKSVKESDFLAMYKEIEKLSKDFDKKVAAVVKKYGYHRVN